MSPLPLLAAAEPAAAQSSIGTPTLWAVTIGAIAVLFVVDFLVTRRPHEVSMKEAVGWSAFYVAIPVGFGVWIWQQYGGDRGLEYYTGYLVEKSLSVDNLFVFLLLLTAFAVPRELQQRVLLIGVAGALVLRGIFIALGAQLIASFSWAFLLFGAVLLVTAVKVGRDALSPADHAVDIGSIRTVRLLRRFWPVTESYDGTRMTVRAAGRRALTPLALVVVAILGTDVVFAIDSVPAVYGITGDPYLVFATNAFALLGLRALYFVRRGRARLAAAPRPRPRRDPRLHRRQARAALGARRLAGGAGGARPWPRWASSSASWRWPRRRACWPTGATGDRPRPTRRPSASRRPADRAGIRAARNGGRTLVTRPPVSSRSATPHGGGRACRLAAARATPEPRCRPRPIPAPAGDEDSTVGGPGDGFRRTAKPWPNGHPDHPVTGSWGDPAGGRAPGISRLGP